MRKHLNIIIIPQFTGGSLDKRLHLSLSFWVVSCDLFSLQNKPPNNIQFTVTAFTRIENTHHSVLISMSRQKRLQLYASAAPEGVQ